MSSKQKVRYGDYLILSSAELSSTQYVAARSMAEATAKVITENRDIAPHMKDISLSLYPNTQELVFQILPRMEYQAYNEIKKMKEDDPRYHIIKRRLVAETQLNLDERKKMHQKVVSFGDVIQLYHGLTNSYLRFSDNKTAVKNTYKVALSKESFDETHFKVLPGVSLKKEGQPLSFFDKLSLNCVSNTMTLSTMEQDEKLFSVDLLAKQQKSQTTKFPPKGKDSKVTIEEDKLPNALSIPICEKVDLFDICNVFCSNIYHSIKPVYEHNNQLSGNGEKRIIVSHVFKFQPILNKSPEGRKKLRYGDFVRIKNIVKSKQQSGYLVADVNYAGFEKSLMYRINIKRNEVNQSSLSSIFQLVPDNFDHWGGLIKFDSNNTCPVSLRHFLSGRFLDIPNNDGKKIDRQPRLSEDFPTFAKTWTKDLQNIENSGPNDREMKPEEKDIFVTRACVEDYLDCYKVFFVKDRGNDDKNLSIGINFTLSNSQEKSLSISEEIADTSRQPGHETNFFEFEYHKLSEKAFQTRKTTVEGLDKADFFILEHVPTRQIDKSIMFSSLLNPLIDIIDSQTYSPGQLSKADYSISEYMDFMKDKSADEEGDEVLYPEVQNSYRELPVLDICVRFFYDYINHGLRGTDHKKYEQLLNKIILFMVQACKENELNCFYLFQFYSLYVSIILGDVWYRPKVKGAEGCNVQLDLLIGSILDMTGFNSTVARRWVSIILRHINFEDYNEKTLNLLINLFQSNDREETRSVEILQLIKEEIFTPKSMQILFRKFVLVDNTPYIQVQEGINTALNRRVAIYEKARKEMRYFTKVVKLATVLCLDYPSVFMKQLKEIFPLNAMVAIIKSHDIDVALKSQVLEFYKECYLVETFANVPSIRHPELLLRPIEDTEALDNADLSIKDKLKQIQLEPKDEKESENTNEGTSIGVKQLILRELLDPENCFMLHQNYLYLRSLMDTLIFIINRGLLTKTELAQSKVALFNFLKYIMVRSPEIVEGTQHLTKSLTSGDNEKDEEKKPLLTECSDEKDQEVRDNDDDSQVRNKKIKALENVDKMGGEVDNKKDKAKKRIMDIQKMVINSVGLIASNSSSKKNNAFEKITEKDLKFIIQILEALECIEKVASNFKYQELVNEKNAFDLFEIPHVNKEEVKKNLNQKTLIQKYTKLEDEKMIPMNKFIEEQAKPVVEARLQKIVERKQMANYDLSTEYQTPSAHYYFTLLDLLSIGDLKVSQESLDIVVYLLNAGQKFVQNVPFIQVVWEDKIEEKDIIFRMAFEKYRNIHKELTSLTNALKTLRITLKDHESSSNSPMLRNLVRINSYIDQLSSSFFKVLDEKESNKILGKKFYTFYTLNVLNTGELVIDEKPGTFINFFNEFYYIMEHFDMNQILLKNLGIIELLFQLIEDLSSGSLGKDLEYPVETLFAKSKLYGKGETQEAKDMVVRDICLKAIAILQFMCIENSHIQVFIRKYIRKSNLFSPMCRFFLNFKSISIYRVFLTFVASVYSTSLELLLNMPQNDPEVIEEIMDRFQQEFDPSTIEQYETYLFMILESFVTYKGLNIYQNTRFILERIKNMNSSEKDKFTDFFSIHLIEALEKTKEAKTYLKGGFRDTIKIDPQYPAEFIEIPVEVSFAQTVINFLAKLSEKASKEQLLEIQLLLPVNVIKQIFKVKHNWNGLKRDLCKFTCTVYLKNRDIDENDFEKMSEIALDVIPQVLIDIDKQNDVQLAKAMTELESQKTILLNPSPLFPSFHISEEVIDSFVDFLSFENENERTDAVASGLAPFMEEYTEILRKSGGKQEKHILAKIIQNLNPKSQHTLFSSIYVPKARRSIRNLSHIVNPLYNQEMEDHDSLKIEEMRAKLKTLINQKKSFFGSTAPANRFSQYASEQSVKRLKDTSYYTTRIEFEDDKKEVEFNFYEDYMPKSYYENIIHKDLEYLMDNFFGILNYDRAKFNSIIKVLLNIVAYEYNTQYNKQASLQLLKSLIVEGKSRNNCNIVMSLVEMGIIGTLCHIFVKFQNDFDFCTDLIELIKLILEEEEEEIQENLIEYFREEDKDNEFMNTINTYLQSTFGAFESSETLRKLFEEQPPGNSGRRADLNMVEQQSRNYMERLINCLEMLRLMCENHYSDLQNFLRSQMVGDVVRYNSVNMITSVSEILEKYSVLMDEKNASLGEKIFEFYIEMLQGPCLPNQQEVCSSKLMETVEDLLIWLIETDEERESQTRTMRTGGKSMFLTSASRKSSLGKTYKSRNNLNQLYTTSSMIENIVTFMSAVLEDNSDKQVVTKMTVHTDFQLFLKRMYNIYHIFGDDINKLAFNIKANSKSLMGGKTLFSFRTKRSKTGTLNASGSMTTGTRAFDDTNAPEETKPLKVLVEKDGIQERVYNPIIMEGIKIWILLQSIGELDDTFRDSLQENIREESIIERKKAVNFFSTKVKSIEILNSQGHLQKIYFPLHHVTGFLSQFSKDKYREEVTRENVNDKIKALFLKADDFYEEMCHFQYLKSKNIPVNLTLIDYMRTLSFVLVVIVNIIQMFSQPEPDYYYSNSIADWVVQGTGVVIMAINIAVFALWFVFSSKLDILRIYERKKESLQEAQTITNSVKRTIALGFFFNSFFFELLMESGLLYLIFNLTMAVLGVFLTRIFFSAMLLDIIGRSDLLKNVVKSVTLNANQLFMTMILGFILIFISGSTTFFTNLRTTLIFMEAPEFTMCTSYIHCYLSLLGFGLRSGGGIGDVIIYPDYQTETVEYYQRFFFDFLFFSIVILIYFNILSGIIIDTFGELRQKKQQAGKLFLIFLIFRS